MLIRKTLYCEFKTLANFNLALGAGETWGLYTKHPSRDSSYFHMKISYSMTDCLLSKLALKILEIQQFNLKEITVIFCWSLKQSNSIEYLESCTWLHLSKVILQCTYTILYHRRNICCA